MACPTHGPQWSTSGVPGSTWNVQRTRRACVGYASAAPAGTAGGSPVRRPKSDDPPDRGSASAAALSSATRNAACTEPTAASCRLGFQSEHSPGIARTGPAAGISLSSGCDSKAVGQSDATLAGQRAPSGSVRRAARESVFGWRSPYPVSAPAEVAPPVLETTDGVGLKSLEASRRAAHALESRCDVPRGTRRSSYRAHRAPRGTAGSVRARPWVRAQRAPLHRQGPVESGYQPAAKTVAAEPFRSRRGHKRGRFDSLAPSPLGRHRCTGGCGQGPKSGAL